MYRFFLPIITLFISFVGLSQTAKDPQLFWEIKSPKGKVSYVYGTYHGNDRKLFNLPDSLYTALKATKMLVVETDIHSITRDLEVRSSAMSMNFDVYGLPYTMSKQPSETLYGNEDGMPHFLDMYLLNLAQLNGIPYTVLESMETQMFLAKGTNFVEQEDSVALDQVLLESTLEGLYVNGDIAGIDRILRKYYSEGLYNRTIIQRNLAMADCIDSLLNKQSAVVLVGAAHLGGQNGVIRLLKSKGWKVRVVSSTSTSDAADKLELRSKKTLEVVNEELAFHSEWPGVPNEMEREGLLGFYYYKELGQGNAYSIELIDRANYESLQDLAKDYIFSPGDAKIIRYETDDGYEYFEGVSDSYPEGYAWVRVIAGDNAFAVLKAYGGNKFMNSNRPQKFFNSCWFIH